MLATFYTPHPQETAERFRLVDVAPGTANVALAGPAETSLLGSRPKQVQWVMSYRPSDCGPAGPSRRLPRGRRAAHQLTGRHRPGLARRNRDDMTNATEYVVARCVLLGALDAIGVHRASVVLVGAQTVYVHAGDTNWPVARNLRTSEPTPSRCVQLRPMSWLRGSLCTGRSPTQSESVPPRSTSWPTTAGPPRISCRLSEPPRCHPAPAAVSFAALTNDLLDALGL